MDLLLPTLAFFSGAGSLSLANRLREHRAEPQGLPDLLGWLHLVAPGTVLQKNGSFLAAWSFRGPDLASATPEELNSLSRQLNDALLPYGDGWMFHFDFIRRPAVGYAPPGAFPDAVTSLLDAERRAAYEGSQAHFVSQSVLAATYLPPSEIYSRLARLFVSGLPPGATAWSAVHAAFEAEAEQLARRLSSRLKVERLEGDALLGHLHSCLTGLDHPVRTPRVPAYLDALLADQHLVGGWTPRIGRLALRVVAIHGFPHESCPGILDFLGALGFPFRASHRIVPLSQQTAARLIARTRLSWFKKRRGATSWLREMTGEKHGGAARERDDELFMDQDAAGMARDASQAAAENASGLVRFCLYTPAIVVSDADAGRADRNAAEIVKTLNDRGFNARVEDLNTLQAFRGTLPGDGYSNLRRPVLSTRNLADLLPATSIWPGLPHNPSPLFPPRSPALLWAATTGATPFWLNLHDDDVGHTLVVGGTGSGKSTLLNLLIAQFLRYPRAQVFSFDVGYSGWLLAKASGARHYDLVNEPVRLQPLAQVDRPGERLWALEWLETVLAINGVPVTPTARQALDAALRLLATEPPRHRRISDFLPQLQDAELAAALSPYAEGSLRHLLDADRDEVSAAADHPYQVFELKRLIDMEDRVLLPVLLYLFHRVEQRLEEGRPSLIVIEEAWLPLMKSVFAARIKQWLLTLRKQNAAVLLATQSLAQLWESPNRHVLLESCPTRILLANPEAATPGHAGLYRDLGLNDAEIALIAHARRKRDYYFKSPRGSRLFELGLGPVALAFIGTPEGMTMADGIAEARALAAAHGSDWPREWLRRRGLAASLDLFDSFAASFSVPIVPLPEGTAERAPARSASTSLVSSATDLDPLAGDEHAPNDPNDPNDPT